MGTEEVRDGDRPLLVQFDEFDNPVITEEIYDVLWHHFSWRVEDVDRILKRRAKDIAHIDLRNRGLVIMYLNEDILGRDAYYWRGAKEPKEH